jgi:ATP-dependent DNA helicase RecG
MENLRYVDKLGRGLPMVWNAAKQLGRPIAFNEIAEEFVVTLGL